MIMMKNTDQPPKLMHFCKVCKKGFSSGGALGGHMRGHGIEDVNAGNNEQHFMSEFRDKRPYFLRTTTNRFVSTYRAREGGGRSFLTWNSLVDEQGKYNLDHQRLQVSTPISPPESFRRSTIMEKYNRNGASREENDLANCLVMLSNGKDNSLALAEDKEVVKGMFQCKACKKVFNSHQALGGHRASHKKVKGCFAARYDNTDNEDMDVEDLLVLEESPTISPLIDLNRTSEAPFVSDHTKRKSKVHECSICHRVFSSGQALGGHKRCHWLAFNMPDTYSLPQFHGFQYDSQQFFKKPMIKESEPVLDLNLPALLEDKNEAHGLSGNNPSNFDSLTRINRDNRKNNEEHCKVKLAKLSDLRDMNLDGDCSTWLQVGIAPTSYGRTAS